MLLPSAAARNSTRSAAALVVDLEDLGFLHVAHPLGIRLEVDGDVEATIGRRLDPDALARGVGHRAPSGLARSRAAADELAGMSVRAGTCRGARPRGRSSASGNIGSSAANGLAARGRDRQHDRERRAPRAAAGARRAAPSRLEEEEAADADVVAPRRPHDGRAPNA